jgi:hypothetical protein
MAVSANREPRLSSQFRAGRERRLDASHVVACPAMRVCSNRAIQLALPLAAALVATAVASPAHAFCRSTTCTHDCDTDFDGCPATGMQLWWASNCVGYTLDSQLTRNLPEINVREAIKQSFYAWADLDCGGGQRASITFTQLDDLACHRTGYRSDGPNVNLVMFQDDDWSYRGIDGTLAKTTVTFSPSTGEILDADIAINSAYNNLSTSDIQVEYDLRSIVTHEVGHLIGLAHSSDFSATMFAAYDPGTVELRTLAPDDVKAVCAAYPPGRAAVCNPYPHGGLATDCYDPAAKEGGCTIASDGPGAPAGFGAAFLATIASGLARAARRRRERA